LGVNYHIANHTKKQWINHGRLNEQNRIFFDGKNGELLGWLIQHIWNGDHVVLVSDLDNFFHNLVFKNVYEDVTEDVIKQYNHLCMKEVFKLRTDYQETIKK